MIKRIIFISIILILLGAGAWYFFGRSGSAPLSQTLTNILPFGNGGDNTTTTPSTTNPTNTGTTNPNAPRAHLFQVSDVPIAGAVSLIKSGNLVIRYVERATGHIEDVDLETLAKSQLVNITIPKVYEAVFKPSGSAVIFRTLRSDGETIDSNAYALIPPSGTSTLDLYTTKVSVLPANIFSLSPGTTTIFYTLKNLPQISSSLFDGTKASTITSLAFNQWRLAAAGDNAVVMTSSASDETDGYSYSLSPSTGEMQKLLGPMVGLIVMPNNNLTRLAYSFDTGDRMILASVNLSSGAVYDIHPATLAEKCTWSTKSKSVIYCAAPTQGLQGGEPDLWYKGMSHYSDRIWKFDTDTDFANVAADPKKDFNTDIDAEHLFLSPKEDYLFFENKNDLTLWALKLD